MPEQTPLDPDDPDDLHDLDDPDDLDDLDDPRNLVERAPDRIPGDISPSLIELDQIPRRLWEQTLAPLHRQQRYWVAQRVADEQLREIAVELAFELDMAECERQDARAVARSKARRAGVPLATPGGDHAAHRPTAQVNIRLRRDDHAQLAQAAAAVGLKPTTLARALVLNGVALTLREHAARIGGRPESQDRVP